MDSNLKIFLNEFENMKGQFVITESSNIERLIAIATDEQDYYYVTYDGRQTRWNSCVGSIIQLKNKINDADYARLIYSAKLNHLDQSTAFGGSSKDEKIKNEILKMNIQHKNKMVEVSGEDKFLTEICWDLI